MIALIDYGSGNVRSVLNALRHEGADVHLVSNAKDLGTARAVILPGVGAFGDCVRGLQTRDLWEPLREGLDTDRPFLGICVGYQLLFEQSEETPGARGFGFFRGAVRKFKTPGLKVPQIGWNSLKLTQPAAALWRGLPDAPHVYFVHSYYPEPEDRGVVTAWTDYGETFAAAAGQAHVAGVQFHPEKSQDVGLGILRNFIRTV